MWRSGERPGQAAPKSRTESQGVSASADGTPWRACPTPIWC